MEQTIAFLAAFAAMGEPVPDAAKPTKAGTIRVGVAAHAAGVPQSDDRLRRSLLPWLKQKCNYGVDNKLLSHWEPGTIAERSLTP